MHERVADPVVEVLVHQHHDAEQDERDEAAHHHLHGDEGELQPGGEQLRDDVPGLRLLVGQHDDLEELERDGEDEEEPEPARQRRHGPALDGPPVQLGHHLVEDGEQRDPGDRRREQEDDRHERRGPPGVGLDGAEDEADVAVEHAGAGQADGGEDGGGAVVDGHAPPARCRRCRAPAWRRRSASSPRLRRAYSMISCAPDEPDLEHQDQQVGRVEHAEAGHGRGEVGGHHHQPAPLRVAEVEVEGQRGHRHEAEGGGHGQPRHRPELLAGRRRGRAPRR